MKKLILSILTLALVLALPFTAMATPAQTAATKFNPQITVTTEGHTNYIIFSMKGATKIGDTYRIYYSPYDRNEEKTNPEWLIKNGKLTTYKTEQNLNPTEMIEIDNTPNQYGTPAIYYTVTLIDINGNESTPTPVRLKALNPSNY